MRLKSVVKYYLSDMKAGVTIFYLVIAVIMLLIVCSMSVSTGDGDIHGGGGEMATVIFLFVAGLNSFKQNFLFLSINGIPRKLQFKGILIMALIVCAGMAAIDTTYSNILTEFFNYKSTFFQVYDAWAIKTTTPIVIVTNFLWSTALHIFAFMGGYFITNLYYKMTKLLKIIVSVGVPVLFTMLIPAFDAVVTGGRIYRWVENVTLALNGLSNGINPFIAMVSYVLITAIVAVLSFLLMKKAIVRE